MVMPHCISRFNTNSRFSSGVFATVSAPAGTPDGDDLVREAYASEEFRRTVAAWGRSG
jgi:hypothetical protein